jgi:hypothetical protein
MKHRSRIEIISLIPEAANGAGAIKTPPGMSAAENYVYIAWRDNRLGNDENIFCKKHNQWNELWKYN